MNIPKFLVKGGKNMKLNLESLKSKADWDRVEIELPGFLVEEMVSKTKSKPTWVHFGAGNIFRSFIAALQQDLLNRKLVETGIVAVESYDEEIIDKTYKSYDNLSLLVLMSPDGNLRKKVIGSVAESLVGDSKRPRDWERVQ
jgi:fructuronate reductase